MKRKKTSGLSLGNPALSFVLVSAFALPSQGATVEVIADQTTQVDGFATLSTNTTWSASDTIILRDALVVPDGLTLTIEPGTTVYATRDDSGTADAADDSVGSIVVSRGGQIEAAGTAAAPIIFTAIEELEVECGTDLNGNNQVGPMPTQTSSGLWGGIILLGNADITVNDGGGIDLNNAQVEGFAPTGVSSDGDAFTDALEYGFDANYPQDDADDSGTLSYVRIQHGGFAFGEGNEINGLTLGGVGTGTTIEFVEIVANSDDGIEFFGGTVNTKNIAVLFCEDDSFDLDNGVTGNHQFWFAIQNPNGDRLGEWDGLNGSLTNVSGASMPMIYNATFVGPGLDVGDGDSALFIDDGFSGLLANSLLTEKEFKLVDFSQDALSGSFTFLNNTIGVFGDFDGSDGATVLSSNAPDDFYVDSFFGLATDDNTEPATALELTLLERNSAGYLVNIDPRPVAGSSAVTASRAPVAPGLETVSYRGAFSPTENWLEGWSYADSNGYLGDNVAPNLVSVVDVVATQASLVNGFATLSANTTWAASDTIYLKDVLVVPDGLTLTIEPGTTVYATRDDNGTADANDDSVGAIVVSRGGQIDASGTAEAPIIFTAVEELEVAQGLDINGDAQVGPMPTLTSSGLWGGIIVLGNADITVNDGGGVDLNNSQVEGFAPTGVSSDGDAFTDALEYGFDSNFPQDDADNSGTLRYLRIQHGGFAFGEGNEINGLTLAGVGSGTTVEFVEIVANSDDGIEFFGGTVNTSNIAVVFCEDDSFDIDNGLKGNHQFWFAIQNPNGDRLGEWDGLNGSLSNVSEASRPQIYNATFVGPGVNVGDEDSALFFDDGFSGLLANSILAEKEFNLVDFSPDALFGSPSFENNTIGVFGSFDGVDEKSVLSTNAPDEFYVDSFFGLPNLGNTSPGAVVEFTSLNRLAAAGSKSGGYLVSIDPRPVVGSSADTGALSTVPAGLVAVDYRGAFAPNDGEGTEENWLAGWSFMAANNLIPSDDVVGPAEIEIVSCELVGGNLVIEFTAAPETTYAVMSDTDLQGFETSEGTAATDAAGAGTATIAVTGVRKFVRIEETAGPN